MPRRPSLPFLAIPALIASLSPARAQQSPPACSVCASYGVPYSVGALHVSALVETSGLAASRRHASIYYAHNDSGDRARFFAITARGELRGEYLVADTTAVDWEDIAVGPCDSASCVYVGDLGDNHARRTSVSIYRVREPDLPADPHSVVTLHAERFEFNYPDGAHDAEALAVDPHSGSIYVFTKSLRHSRVYRLDPPFAPHAVAHFVRDLPTANGLFPMVTAADIHPCAPRVLLRTYSGAIEFRAPTGGSIDDALGTSGVPVPAAIEYQSEAIAYRADGRGYLTVPEGDGAEIHAVDCGP